MRDWKVIVAISGHRFKTACEQFVALGPVSRTRYYNVLATKVDHVRTFAETLRDWVTNVPYTVESIARIAPVRYNCRKV